MYGVVVACLSMFFDGQILEQLRVHFGWCWEVQFSLGALKE
jgi:hypothetical protein